MSAVTNAKDGSATLDPLEHVDHMLTHRAAFENIEAYIDGLRLPDTAKSALWLHAWVETDRTARRRAVADLLETGAHDLGLRALPTHH